MKTFKGYCIPDKLEFHDWITEKDVKTDLCWFITNRDLGFGKDICQENNYFYKKCSESEICKNCIFSYDNKEIRLEYWKYLQKCKEEENLIKPGDFAISLLDTFEIITVFGVIKFSREFGEFRDKTYPTNNNYYEVIFRPKDVEDYSTLLNYFISFRQGKAELNEICNKCKHLIIYNKNTDNNKEKIKKVYTKEFILKTINEIAEKNDIKITFNEGDKDLKNRAWSSGNEISFSRYDNIEYMFISFFHEYAHIKLKDKISFKVKGYDWNLTSSMQFEIQVTMAGLNFAQELGFIFSDDAVKWLLKENFSYGSGLNDLYGILKIKDDKESYELKQCFEIDKYLDKNK